MIPWAFGEDAGPSPIKQFAGTVCTQELAQALYTPASETEILMTRGNQFFYPGKPGQSYYVHGFRSQAACDMKAATGKALPDWVKLATKSGKTKHGELVSWLKSEYGITHGYANLIAHNVLKSDSGSKIAAGDDLVSEMFGGDKAELRPIYDALMKHITSFGTDIEPSPKKGYLSLRRTTQFDAEIVKWLKQAYEMA